MNYILKFCWDERKEYFHLFHSLQSQSFFVLTFGLVFIHFQNIFNFTGPIEMNKDTLKIHILFFSSLPAVFPACPNHIYQ